VDDRHNGNGIAGPIYRILDWFGPATLIVAICGTTLSLVRAFLMPHYAGTAHEPDPGFNTWYWHLVDSGSLFLLVAGFFGGLVNYRHRIGQLAIAVSVAHTGFVIYDLRNWLPDF
jgi:hypothetical protein